MPAIVRRWADRLFLAETEAEVLKLAQRYVATWDSDDLSALPERCRPSQLETGEDITRIAFRLVTAECEPGASTRAAKRFDELRAFFQYASHRVTQVIALRTRGNHSASLS